MKKQFDESIYDTSLERLDSEISWNIDRKRKMRKKIAADLTRRNMRSKTQKVFVYSSTVVAALLAFIIFGYNLVMDNSNDIQSAAPHNQNVHNVHGASKGNIDFPLFPANGEVKGNTFTMNDQTSFIISDEATVPVDIRKVLPNITGYASMANSTNLQDVMVDYPYKNKGNSLLVRVLPNDEEINEIIKELTNKESGYKEMKISNKHAVLWENTEKTSPQVFIVTKQFMYTIQYAYNQQPIIDEKPLIDLAKQIQFYQ